METKLISEHLCRVFAALRGAEWQTAKEVKAAASVSIRTASNHLQRLVAWGVAGAEPRVSLPAQGETGLISAQAHGRNRTGDFGDFQQGLSQRRNTTHTP